MDDEPNAGAAAAMPGRPTDPLSPYPDPVRLSPPNLIGPGMVALSEYPRLVDWPAGPRVELGSVSVCPGAVRLSLPAIGDGLLTAADGALIARQQHGPHATREATRLEPVLIAPGCLELRPRPARIGGIVATARAGPWS